MQPFQYSGSYEEFLARMRRNLQDQNISAEIFALLKKGFEKALNEQNAVLSRKERVLSFQTLSKEVLAGLIHQLDES